MGGAKTLQYQVDIVEAKFKEIVARGARVSREATKNDLKKTAGTEGKPCSRWPQPAPAASAASVPRRVYRSSTLLLSSGYTRFDSKT